MENDKNYQREVIDKDTNRKVIFDVDIDKLDMLRLKELNGMYKDEEERLKVAGGNLIDSFLNVVGVMVLKFMTTPLASGEPTSENTMTRLLRTGQIEAKWPPFDGSEGIDLIYLGTADRDTESILIEKCSKVRENIRADFANLFEECFNEMKQNAEDDKLVVAPVRVDTEGKSCLMVKLGFDFRKLTCEKLQRVFDATPEEVISSVLLHTGREDRLSANPVDLLLVTLSRVVEVLVVHGEQEPWKFLEETPPWGWPAFDKEFGLYVFEVSSNSKNNVLPKVTPKNLNHLLKASLGLAETSNLH